jgi:hypothetical protein
MTEEKLDRRSTDAAHDRIDQLKADLVQCSTKVTLSIQSLTDRFSEMAEALERNTEALKSYQDLGLPEMIKEHNIQKAFIDKSEILGKRIVFLGKVAATLGGTIAAIAYALTHYGSWPSGTP